jgi:hypothetical protein
VRRTGLVSSLSAVLFVAAAQWATAAQLPQGSLRSGTAASSGAWAVLPLGRLADQANTFWQLLHLPPGSSTWSTATPEGTADNGGLVAGVSGISAVAGILPSGSLTFSPLASTPDGGKSWSPAYLPGAVAHLPDGLALESPAGKVLAVVGTRVLLAPAGIASWSTLVTLSTLQRASKSCDARRLQAVAFTAGGSALVGVQCRHGVGLFTDATGSWHHTGPSSVTKARTAPTSVIRLVSTGSTTTALLATVRSGRTELAALWEAADGTWTTSPALGVQSAGPVATSVAADGGIAVLLGSSHGLAVEAVAPGGTKWSKLPRPPHQTVALATSGGTSTSPDQTDLFTAEGAQLGVYALSPTGTSWVQTQSSQVPLAYGSSS